MDRRRARHGSVIVGGTAFVAPDKVLAALLSFFGIFALADGIFTIGAGLASNWHARS